MGGKGFDNVLNLSGGIKAWESNVVVGDETLGLALFTDIQSTEQVLGLGYSLEDGLRDFYLSMTERVPGEAVKDMFKRLADIEIGHKRRLFEIYSKVAENPVDRETFESDIVAPAAEGGLTTEQYLELFKPDLNSAEGAIQMAMSIEAQAMDLYFRAADRREASPAREFLLQIASEEKTHLKVLGKMMDRLTVQSA